MLPPAALQAHGAVARREGGVVLVGTERRLELEEGLQVAAQVFGAAHAKARRLIFDARAPRQRRGAATRLDGFRRDVHLAVQHDRVGGLRHGGGRDEGASNCQSDQIFVHQNLLC
jgi:hypothetical protein